MGGGAIDTNLWIIYRIQKIALRMILNKRKGTSTLDDCRHYKLLRLPELHQHAISMFMYKYTNGMLPDIFKDFFKLNSDNHHYNTRNANKLSTPMVKTKLATKFIKQTGVLSWNHLENNMEVKCKIGTFKNLLKSFLVRDY